MTPFLIMAGFSRLVEKILGKKNGEETKGKVSGPDPCDRLSAELALPLLDMDFADGITLAEDEELLTSGAVGSFPFMAGDIADVNVLQPSIHSDLAILLQGGDRGRGEVAQLVKGVEPGEMNWCVRAQFVFNPGAHLAHILHAVILSRDHQIGNI